MQLASKSVETNEKKQSVDVNDEPSDPFVYPSNLSPKVTTSDEAHSHAVSPIDRQHWPY